MLAVDSPLAEIQTSVGQVVGLLEAIDEASGSEDAAQIAREGKLHADAIPAIIILAEQLGLVSVDDGDVILMDQGRRVLHASIADRRKVFAGLLNKQDWMQEVERTLRSQGGSADRAQVVTALATKYGTYQAEALVHTAVYWGRYCGLLRYNSHTERLSLTKHPPG